MAQVMRFNEQTSDYSQLIMKTALLVVALIKLIDCNPAVFGGVTTPHHLVVAPEPLHVIPSRDAHPTPPSSHFDYEAYNSYDEIVAELERLAALHDPLSKLKVIGQTYEHRDIHVLKIGDSPNNARIVIECGIHAREWISPATCMTIIKDILDNRTLLDKYLQ